MCVFVCVAFYNSYFAYHRDEFAGKEKKLREDSDASVAQLKDENQKSLGKCEGKMSGVREEAAAACSKELDSKVDAACTARVEEMEKEVAAASESGAVCEGKLVLAQGAVKACEAQKVYKCA